MSTWDPWWVHGDYAETYHGAPDDEDDLTELEANLKVMRSDPAAPGNVWVNLIHDWTQADRDAFLESRFVPINPVAKALCRSGECMCGTMQSPQERVEAAAIYPEWGAWIDGLEAEVVALHGFGWGVSMPRQHSLRLREQDLFQPACVGCNRRAAAVPALPAAPSPHAGEK